MTFAEPTVATVSHQLMSLGLSVMKLSTITARQLFIDVKGSSTVLNETKTKKKADMHAHLAQTPSVNVY